MAQSTMPAIFFGHGNPMNAIAENPWAEKWNAIGRALPTPKAVLAISAHWYVEHTAVTASAAPRTIHDFGGFPRALYEVQYRAPGDLQLAQRVRELLAPEVAVVMDEHWGFDHGTWSVLAHVFPNADVPVVQLSIDETQPPQFHYAIGKRLAPLRDEGVLVIGSGNVVHNLHTFAWGRHPAEPFDWAQRFELRVRELVSANEHAPLVDYESLGRDALLSVPTPDHYLPLLYILGMRKETDAVTFPVDGIDGGSVSMLAVDMRSTG
jgi:4,5-DOPA dioxygenase extradiol